MGVRRWRRVRGHRQRYKVSDDGQVYSIRRQRMGKGGKPVWCGGRRLKPFLDGGYWFVNLCRNGKWRKTAVHILVARAFIPNPSNLPEVNHKDGIKSNCHVTNLEWVTRQGNSDHASVMGLLTGNRNGRKLTKDDIPAIRKRLAAGESQRKIGLDYDINQSSISDIARGKAWFHV